MNVKILKKLSAKVVFRTNVLETGKKEYLVERKSSDTREWDILARSIRIERALAKKHNAMLAELHFLNLTSALLTRRKHGKTPWFHKRRKRKSPNFKKL